MKEKIRKEREEREENERREREKEGEEMQQKEELRMRHQYEEEFLFEKAKDSGFRCFSKVCYQTIMSHNFDINLST